MAPEIPIELRTRPPPVVIVNVELQIPTPGSAINDILVIRPLHMNCIPGTDLISPSCVEYTPSFSSDPLPRTSTRLGKPLVNVPPTTDRYVSLSQCNHFTL